MQKETEERIINPLYILIWLGLSLWVGLNHEPFADEAQAYLIARDASVWDIITRVSRTEGTPALWYLWLKFLIFCGLNYSQLYVASIIPNVVALYLFISKAPFAKYIKYIFPLTYFVLYQYNIVARNYSLLFLMTSLAAISFTNRKQHPYRLILSLWLLGSVSSHAFFLSCSIVMFWIYKDADKEEGIRGYRAFIEKNIKALVIFIIFAVFTALYVYPETSNQYLQNYQMLTGYHTRNILNLLSSGLITSRKLLPENIWYIYIGLFYFIGMVYLLSKGYGVKFWILWLPNLVFMCMVKYKLWHAGIFIMTALFMFWVEPNKINIKLKLGLGILIVTELIWSCVGVIKDINGKYAVSEEVYAFLEEEKIPHQAIEQISFNSVGMNPYYENKSMSYWDWSKYGFVKKGDINQLISKKAIILNKELYVYSKEKIKELQQRGDYRMKTFISQHFFGLQDMSQDETLYVLYRK